jgi:hypothetical protein
MAEVGKINRLSISELQLDPLNPRLPEDVQGGSQDELAEYVAQAYDALSVATSIAEHGYFESEPLIAVPEGTAFVVVEGNRRLTALLGLTNDRIRQFLDSSAQWERVSEDARAKDNVPVDVPVLLVSDRKAVAPIIGFRHISGIMQWEPFAKARFIASLVDDEGLSFADVGALVGEKRGDVASNYRNYSILRQARDNHDLDTDRVEEAFGVFTAAMGQRALRTFIGAPDPGVVEPGANPIPDDKSAELGQLLTWIFGDDDGGGRVIAESRDLGLLGRVVSSEAGLRSLKAQGDLQTAADASSEGAGDARRRVVTKLMTGRTSLRGAAELLTEVGELDEELSALIEDCDEALADLKALFAS